MSNEIRTPRIPVVIVSGFLGSGKTTLVRHLLNDAQEKSIRMAVISNEFGALGIDRALLSGSGSGTMIELEGGCVCCELSSELVDTLQKLHTEVEPDRIIIETSGLAFPFETQLQLWREPVSQWVSEDIAVVVVNAEQLAANREVADLFEQQVSSADLLLLNQLDQVPEAQIPDLKAKLSDQAPETPIVLSSYCKIDPEIIFVDQRIRSTSEKETAPRPHTHPNYSSKEIVIDNQPSASELKTRLEKLNALRIKGFVQCKEGFRLVQGVGPRIELTAVDNLPDEATLNHIIVIR